MRALLYVGLHDGRVYSSASGTGYTFPTYRARQTRPFALRFLNLVNGVVVEEELHIRSLKASIGWISRPPGSGNFKFKIGTAPTTAANTTSQLEWNVGQADLKTKLNAVASRPGDLRVLLLGPGHWLIGREDGAAVDLSIVENTLDPLSAANIEGTEIAGAWWYECQLLQVPLAFTDSAETVLPAAPTIETIVDGYTDPSGTYFVNEIQRFRLPADFRALFYFRYNSERTDLLSVEDGIDRYKVVLDAILARQAGRVATRNPQTNVVDIEFQGELSGIDVDELEIVIPPESTPPGDQTFSLDLGLWPMLAALRGSEELKDVPFEVHAEVVPTAADIENLAVPSRSIKLFNVPLSIARPLIWPALATVQDIPWLRGPAPKNYVPSVPAQILTGQQQAYPTVIGDAIATAFVIDHNLGSEVAYVIVRENEADGRVLLPSEYTLTIGSADSLTITFAAAPAAGSLLVNIVAIGPASVFQAHSHTIAQIDGLQDILDEYGSDIADLLAILPNTGPGATASSTTGMVTLLPKLAEILHLPAGDYLSADGGLDPATLPDRAPFMLTALHDATVDTLTNPLPVASTNAGKVFKNESGNSVMIPGGGGLRSQYVVDDGFVGCDGRNLFVTKRDGATNSYYPTAFDRTLFTLAINDKQLAVGRTLGVEFAVQLQLAAAARNADLFCQAQWVFLLELGTAPADTTPDPVGLNLANITWSATPIFEQRIILDPLFRSHAFGLRIKRLAGGLSLDQQVYGIWSGNTAAAPASANFVLRARLAKFDTENNQPLARGFVFLGLSNGLDGEGKPKTGPAQAVIT